MLPGLSGFIKLHEDLHIQMPKWRKNGVAGTGKWRRKMSLIQRPVPAHSTPINDFAQDVVIAASWALQFYFNYTIYRYHCFSFGSPRMQFSGGPLEEDILAG